MMVVGGDAGGGIFGGEVLLGEMFGVGGGETVEGMPITGVYSPSRLIVAIWLLWSSHLAAQGRSFVLSAWWCISIHESRCL